MSPPGASKHGSVCVSVARQLCTIRLPVSSFSLIQRLASVAVIALTLSCLHDRHSPHEPFTQCRTVRMLFPRLREASIRNRRELRRAFEATYQNESPKRGHTPKIDSSQPWTSHTRRPAINCAPVLDNLPRVGRGSEQVRLVAMDSHGRARAVLMRRWAALWQTPSWHALPHQTSRLWATRLRASTCAGQVSDDKCKTGLVHTSLL